MGATKRASPPTGIDVSDASDLSAQARPSIEEVYRDSRAILVRLAYLLTGSRDVAEDVVQTAFAAAQERWAFIDEPLAYLRQVIVNQAHETHRHRYRHPPDIAAPVTHLPEIDETWNELRRLPPAQRAVVVLRFYEDLPLTEIAQLVERPASTVRSDLRRALDRLRRTLS